MGENTPMRIISLNANGIRSAHRKGAFDWLNQQSADFICLQELKAQVGDIEADLRAIQGRESALLGDFACAEKKGYSGVGIYCNKAHTSISSGFGIEEFDSEGRLIRADRRGLTVMSLYAPSGSASEERQASKFRFMDAFLPILREWMREHRDTGREFVICGDWNIAHTEQDLKNWKGNLKNSGFLPEERAWLDEVLNGLGWVDVYRSLYPHATEEGYTWWSNRGQARANNVGWRIDYLVATPGIASRAQTASVYKAQSFSDHAPLVVDFKD